MCHFIREYTPHHTLSPSQRVVSTKIISKSTPSSFLISFFKQMARTKQTSRKPPKQVEAERKREEAARAARKQKKEQKKAKPSKKPKKAKEAKKKEVIFILFSLYD